MAARKLSTSFSGTGPLQALQQQLKEGRLGKKKRRVKYISQPSRRLLWNGVCGGQLEGVCFKIFQLMFTVLGGCWCSGAEWTWVSRLKHLGSDRNVWVSETGDWVRWKLVMGRLESGGEKNKGEGRSDKEVCWGRWLSRGHKGDVSWGWRTFCWRSRQWEKPAVAGPELEA